MTVTIDDKVDLDEVSFEPEYEENSPRAVAYIDGIVYQLNGYTITTNTHGAAGSATITLPIESNPDFSVQLFRGPTSGQHTDFTKLSQQQIQQLLATPGNFDTSPVSVEIWAGYPENAAVGSTDLSQLVRRFLGQVDLYNPKFGQGTIIFQCRSLAAPLIDDKLQQFSPNMKTTDFVSQQAAAVGLTPVINLDPDVAAAYLQEVLGYDNVGGTNFYSAVYGLHPWDLILRCAQYDDCDAWVQDKYLHYEAPSLIKRNAVSLKYGRDWKSDLEGTHAPQFSKNIQVEVKTYKPRQKKSVTTRVSTAPGGGAIVEQSVKNVTSQIIPGTSESLSTYVAPDGTSVATLTSYSPGGPFTGSAAQARKQSTKDRYVFYVKGIDPARANALAKAIWRQISMHEYSVVGTVPMRKKWLANLAAEQVASGIAITSKLAISGLPYQFFNDTYWPREILETFSMTDGWTLKITAANELPPIGGV